MRNLHYHGNNPLHPPTNPQQHQCHSCNLPLITVIMMINNTNSLSSLAPGRRIETKARLRHLKNWHQRSNQRLLMQLPVGMVQRCLPDVPRSALLHCDVPLQKVPDWCSWMLWIQPSSLTSCQMKDSAEFPCRMALIWMASREKNKMK